MKRLLCLALLAACDSATEIPEIKSDVARDLQPNVSATDLATVVDGNTELGADLYRQVRSGQGNLFLSPHSISTALAMTYAGASGATATQMADVLHFDLPADQLHAAFDKLDLDLASRATKATDQTIPFRLKTGNALFGQDGETWMQPFLDTLARNYGAGMRVLDFATDADGSRKTINRWVEDQTNDKIKDLLSPADITSATKLVLTNAIYFSGAWDEPFDASETANRAFHLASGETISTPTLHQVFVRGYAAGDGYQVAELPYDGQQLSMVVVVPDDLAAFETSLDGARIKQIVESITPVELDLSLPKFKFDAPLGLKPVLVALGMTEAFSGDADFSGITGTRNLSIQDVVHKGFVSIDEKGTEAAAATAVIVGDSLNPNSATLAVDKPFVFFIRDVPTGEILFIGRVVDPR